MAEDNLKNRSVYFIFYLLGLGLLITGFLYPSTRSWGFNHLAYQANLFMILYLGLFLILAAIIYRLKIDQYNFRANKTIFGIIVIIYPVLFYFLRIKTFFLGDGYQNLELLKQTDPPIKFSNYGETLAHLGFKNLLGGTEHDALISFQVISFVSGLLLLIFLNYAAFKMFDRQFDRLAFVLGLGSGGYIFLSFGYVEYYSLFVMSVAIFLVAGLLIAQKKLNRFVIIPLWLLALFFHLLAFTLLPAVVYLLYQNSSLSRKIKPTLLKIIVTVFFIKGILLFAYFYNNYYFFKFAFIPIVSNRFTLNSYTLLSLNHLLDSLNLLILLSPGIIIFLSILLTKFTWTSLKKPELIFLMIGSISAFGAVFILDPKLGMPRDWDLFSYSGIFIVGFVIIYLLLNKEKLRSYKSILSLIVLLNFAFLFSRAVAQHHEEVAIKHLKNYINFDPVKNQSVYLPLIKYYSNLGDQQKIEELRSERDKRYPSRLLNKEGLTEYNQGNLDQAMKNINEALKYNPVNSGIYGNLALCLMELKQYDSALTLLQIADGLNPGNNINYSNLGDCYYLKNDYKEAERYYLKSLSLDSNGFNALGGDDALMSGPKAD